MRLLLGTGFCGALTTFSAVVVAADRMCAHGHAGTALLYLLATVAGGLAAGALGLAVARAVAGNGRFRPDERSPVWGCAARPSDSRFSSGTTTTTGTTRSAARSSG